MLHNHTFSQRNKATEKAVEVKAGGKKEGVGENFLKRGGRKYRRVFIKQGVRNPLPTMYLDFVMSKVCEFFFKCFLSNAEQRKKY